MTPPDGSRSDGALPADDVAVTPVQIEMRAFLALFWVTVVIPLVAHFVDDGFSDGFRIALLVSVGLGMWMHGVFRVHRLDSVEMPVRRSLVMLFGLFAALAVLMMLYEGYTFLLFGAYSLTFGYGGTFRLGLVLTLIPTAIWAFTWISYDFPAGALATPFFVWVTANVISYFTHQVASRSAERGHLLQEIADTREELAAEERRRGVIEERSRVAGEIHDTLAQGFTSIVLLAKGTAARIDDLDRDAMIHNLELIESTARDNLAEARRLVEALRPAVLESANLPEALRRLATGHTARTGVPVTVEVVGQVAPLGGSGDVVLLRTVQEALSNAQKHAGASRITIGVAYGDGVVDIAITDDGVGFHPDAAPRPVAGGTGGQGLAIMRDRVQAVAGVIEVDSTPGHGCTVRVRVPSGQPEPGLDRVDASDDGGGT